MKKNLLFYKRGTLLAAVAALLALGSCVHEEPPGGGKESVAEDAVRLRVETVPAGTRTAPARTVYNPYLLDNVRTSAAAAGMTRAEDIQPTHYYVRFRPATDDLYDLVREDKTLDFYSYPLDVETPEGAKGYIDYEQPEESPQFIFTWVPVGYVFPEGVDYDILGELVLDGDIPVSDSGGITRSGIGYTGDEPGLFLMSSTIPNTADPGVFAERHFGNIKVWDDLMNRYVPLEGVRVRIRYSTYGSELAYTDSNGNFVFGNWYGTAATYSIEWTDDDIFYIRDENVNAEYVGHDSTQPFNLRIGGESDTGSQARFATMHRAIWRYAYGNTGGLWPLRGSTQWLKPGKLRADYSDKYVQDKSGYFFYNPVWPFATRIEIYGRDSATTYRSLWEILSIAFHETGHFVHYINMTRFSDVSLNICESWAEFTLYFLTRLEYIERGASDSVIDRIYNEFSLQWWPYEKSNTSSMAENPKYSSIFIDLWDDHNQSTGNTNLWIYPDDNVVGYTPAMLNAILIDGSYGYNKLKTRLKANKPSGVTDAQIDNLYKRYHEIWGN